MHTSRRDAFRSIDVMPYAKVDVKGEIQYMRDDYKKKDKTGKPNLVARFDSRIALVKLHPHFDYRVLEFYEKNGVRGIILEGTGLGHAPVRHMDDYTKHHPKLLETIERMTKNGIIIGMTSECPYGKVNLNVYTNLRLLQDAGVIGLPMTPQSAFVKLGWVLGHTRNSEDAKKMLIEEQAGEFTKRVDARAFEDL
jgi:glutamyl-tRNA(Gln) amidotransferase subunit D